MTTAKPKAIDLFSGCGGLTLGLRNAGFQVVAAVDADPLAVSTYRRNHRRTKLVTQDIRQVDPASLKRLLKLKVGELDLLAGCPPCQGFSTLRTQNGGRQIEDPMNDLVFEVLRFLKVFKPRAVMLENVPGLLSDDRLGKFGRALRKLNYQFEAKVFDAANFGVPQRRRRMILMAVRGATPKFAIADEVAITVREAIGHLPYPRTSDDPAHNYTTVRGKRTKQLIANIPRNGGSRSSLPKKLQLECHKDVAGFRDVYGRMSWSLPAPTMTGGCINPSRGRFLHPTQNRSITLREAALLQGFPSDYNFDLSRGRYPVAQLIGNAFPPSFAEKHARVLRKQLLALSRK